MLAPGSVVFVAEVPGIRVPYWIHSLIGPSAYDCVSGGFRGQLRRCSLRKECYRGAACAFSTDRTDPGIDTCECEKEVLPRGRIAREGIFPDAGEQLSTAGDLLSAQAVT
jgi:hypothetical protein